MSKEDREIPECDIYIGDGISGNFNDCVYRHAASCQNIIANRP